MISRISSIRSVALRLLKAQNTGRFARYACKCGPDHNFVS
jgi:hypothetical protein